VRVRNALPRSQATVDVDMAELLTGSTGDRQRPSARQDDRPAHGHRQRRRWPARETMSLRDRYWRAPIAVILACLALEACEGRPATPGHTGNSTGSMVPANEAGATSSLDGTSPAAGPAQAGRWSSRRELPPESAVSDEDRQRLGALGYLDASRAEARAGVTVYKSDEVAPGLNFYTSGHAPEAVLVDSHGKELHRWRCEIERAFPAIQVPEGDPYAYFLRRAHLFENGDILAIFEGRGIVKLDRDSRILWAVANGAHHDLEIAPDGDIYVLTRDLHVVPRVDPRNAILEDFVTVLGSDGTTKRKTSILEALERSQSSWLWSPEQRPAGSIFFTDIFHTNTIELLRGDHAHRVPAFAKGSYLVSLLATDTIAVVDPALPVITWAARGRFRRQHDPQLLANGRFLIFDNHGLRGESAVIEMEPTTGEIVWEYRGTREAPFYSECCGTAQRLPNGNTLITESDGGRAFEATTDRKIVWEYFNPHRGGKHDELIATLFELRRMPLDFPTDWLRAQGSSVAPARP
jgi:hypothetical protein